MKSLLFACIFFISYQNLFSQWVWQNPIPQGNNLNHLQIITSEIMYAAGDAGTILKSESAGEDWQILNFPSYINIGGMCFLSEYKGWVIGDVNNRSELYKTTDGGAEWEIILTDTGEYTAVYFLDDNSGWIGIDSFFYSTTDGGNSWNKTTMLDDIIKIYFTSADSGWVLFKNAVSRTTDGGDSWENTILSLYPFFIMSDIKMLNNTTGYIIGGDPWWQSPYHGGSVFKTTDGGASWTENFMEGFFIVCTEFQNEQIGWILTYNMTSHRTFKTIDGGNQWNLIGSGNWWAKKIRINDEIKLWGVGYGGYIITSNDSGATWQHKTTGTRNELSYINMLNENYGYTSGADIFLKTTNGGKLWEQKQAPVTSNAGELLFVDSLTGFLCAYDLWKTTDGAESWTNVLPTIRGLDFINKDTGWAYSSQKIYKTTDCGLNWLYKSEIEFFYSMEFVDDNTGFCGGYIGLAKTTDGAATWSNIILSSPMIITDIHFIDTLTGWVTGYGTTNPAILKTTDGGLTWVNQYSLVAGGWGPKRNFFFLDSLHGWAVINDNPKLIFTTDGGNNWNPYDIPTYNYINGMWFTGNKGWMIGDWGTILFNDNIITGTNGEPYFINTPVKLELSQNYPNPFNPSTSIKYSVPQTSYVTVKIYDILGNQIETLVNEEKPPGNYEITWNAAGLPSGVYFYRIQAGSSNQTKKMIFLK